MAIIHILDHQSDQVLDDITQQHVYSNQHTRSLKDYLETFEMEIRADRPFSEYLSKRNRIIFPGENGNLREFIIYESIERRIGRSIEVYAEASYLQDLKKSKKIKAHTTTAETAQQHAEIALEDTGWLVGNVKYAGIRTLTFENRTDPFGYLKRIAREFELELDFRIEMVDGKIYRYVDLVERLGTWRGREVRFGKDLKNLERIENTEDIVTALHVLGPEQEDGTRLDIFVEDNDARKRWGRKGNHLIGDYEPQSSDLDMTEDRLRQLGEQELAKRINAFVEYKGQIVDTEHVPGLDHEVIRFADTIHIKDESYSPVLYLEARLHSQSRDIFVKSQKEIELGDFVRFTEEEETGDIFKQLREQINNKITAAEAEAKIIERTYDKATIDDKDDDVYEDGKTFAEAVGVEAKEYADTQDSSLKTAVESYADDVASTAEDNAKYYADGVGDDLRNYAVAQEVYDTKMSQIASDLADRAPIEYVDGQIRQIEVGGRNLLLNSDFTNGLMHWSIGSNYSAVVDENERLNGLNSVKITANSSTTDGTSGNRIFQYNFGSDSTNLSPFVASAYVKADRSVRIGVRNGPSSGRIDWFNVSTNWVRVESLASGNKFLVFAEEPCTFWVAQPKTEKGNKATDWSPAPEDYFSEIEKKADGSTVYTIEEVDNMINNVVSVTEYETDMDGIVTDLTDHSTRIGQNETAIGLKADQTELDTVAGTVSDHTGTLDVMADEISQKATTAEVDAIEGRLTTAEGQITTQAGLIEAKAESSVVDDLGGRVTTAELAIDGLEGEIVSKVEENDVRSIFTQEASSFTFEADQINFDGHVFGTNATFEGTIFGSTIESSEFVSELREESSQFEFTEWSTVLKRGSLEIEEYYESSYSGPPVGAYRKTSITDLGLTYDFGGAGRDVSLSFHAGDLLYEETGSNIMHFGIDLTGLGHKIYTRYDLDTKKVYTPLYIESENLAISKNLTAINGSVILSTINDSRMLSLNDQNHISVSSTQGGIVNYADRSNSMTWRVRSHNGDMNNLRDDFWIASDGRFFSASLYNNTSSSTQNARVSYEGADDHNASVYRVVSARKYKTDIQPIDLDPYKIHKVNLKSWLDKGDIERSGGSYDVNKNYGLIADEVAEAGLAEYVDYMDGEIEGLAYERLWTLLIPISKDHEEKIYKSEIDIDFLKGEYQKLEARLSELEGLMNAS